MLGGGGGRREGVRGRKGRILRKKREWLKRRVYGRKRNRGERLGRHGKEGGGR